MPKRTEEEIFAKYLKDNKAKATYQCPRCETECVKTLTRLDNSDIMCWRGGCDVILFYEQVIQLQEYRNEREASV